MTFENEDAAAGGSEDVLAGHPLFAGLDQEVLQALRAASSEQRVGAGETLIVEGDPGDAAYLVLGGRFAVTVDGRLVGRPSRGDLIGEMALLVDEPRSATVIAQRASLVLRIDGSAFAALVGANPALHRRVSAQLVDRIRRANAGPAVESHGRVLAVVVEPDPLTTSIAAQLAAAFEQLGHSTAVRPVGSAGIDSATVTIAELEHDVVLLVPSPDDADAIAAATEHADRVLLVVSARSSTRSDVGLRLPDRAPPVELVLVHRPEVDCPRGTHRWLAALRPAAHHQVRAGDPAHLQRLVRRLTRTEVALVLSGGGARGLAHIGTYRALIEAGVPIDVVAGVSSGSIFALAIARGWDPERTESTARQMLVEGGSLVDFTLPTIALARGRRITRRIQEAFGDDDLRLEDLWLPTLVLSANLTTAEVHEHRVGPAWRAVRASVAIPGVFPPMAEPEGLLVDGGLVENLPVGRVQRAHPGALVVASDVGRRVDFVPAGFPGDGEVSGWAALRLRSRLRRRERRIPGVVGLLGRLTALGGAGTPLERGDMHIDHQLPGIAMFDFAKGSEAIEAGYRRAKEALADLDAARLPFDASVLSPTRL